MRIHFPRSTLTSIVKQRVVTSRPGHQPVRNRALNDIGFSQVLKWRRALTPTQQHSNSGRSRRARRISDLLSEINPSPASFPFFARGTPLTAELAYDSNGGCVPVLSYGEVLSIHDAARQVPRSVRHARRRTTSAKRAPSGLPHAQGKTTGS